MLYDVTSGGALAVRARFARVVLAPFAPIWVDNAPLGAGAGDT
jgi:hypothetical protein